MVRARVELLDCWLPEAIPETTSRIQGKIEICLMWWGHVLLAVELTGQLPCIVVYLQLSPLNWLIRWLHNLSQWLAVFARDCTAHLFLSSDNTRDPTVRKRANPAIHAGWRSGRLWSIIPLSRMWERRIVQTFIVGLWSSQDVPRFNSINYDLSLWHLESLDTISAYLTRRNLSFRRHHSFWSHISPFRSKDWFQLLSNLCVGLTFWSGFFRGGKRDDGQQTFESGVFNAFERWPMTLFIHPMWLKDTLHLLPFSIFPFKR